jgi:hypothetical protein
MNRIEDLLMEVRSEETELLRTETEPVMVVIAEARFLLIELAVVMTSSGRVTTVPSTVESVDATSSETGSRFSMIESAVVMTSSGTPTTVPSMVESVEATSSTGSRFSTIDSVVAMRLSGRPTTVPSTVESVEATSRDTGAAMAWDPRVRAAIAMVRNCILDERL